MNRFGFEVLEKLRKEAPNDNILFSPLSIASAFALVYFGARGATKEEMDMVFEFRVMEGCGIADWSDCGMGMKGMWGWSWGGCCCVVGGDCRDLQV